MSGFEYAVGALVVLAVLAFVVRPLVQRRRLTAVATVGATALEQRAAIYQELLELELDRKVGKMTEADYQEMSESLLLRAAALFPNEQPEADAATRGEDDEIEREIASVRSTLGSTGSSPAEARG